jgi:peptidoglycan/xylan/chitin deacetylase (PgdA/CDA1 family)
MQSLRAALDAGYRVAYSVGLLDLLRTMRAARVPVLCYHSILPGDVPALRAGGLHTTAEAFQEQLAYLVRYYRVVPLMDVVEDLRAGRQPHPRSVVISFDDGYSNNLHVAAPILAQFGCVGTVFLATGYIGSSSPFWWDEVALILSEATGRSGSAPEWDHVQLGTNDGVTALRRRADELLAAATIAQRRARLDALRSALGASSEPPSGLGLVPLGWDECLSAPASLSFGGHTYSHRLLDRIPAAESEEEVRRCAADLAPLGHRAVPCFCYPAGRWTEQVRAVLPRLGFVAAVDAQGSPARERLAGLGADLLLLPRIGVAGGISLPRFAAHVAGARAWGLRG